MRRALVWLVVGVLAAVAILAGGAVAAFPTIRHQIVGLWNVPDRMPALPDNTLVHYQPGAEEYAHEVAALLPDAISRVETAHGRRLKQPVTVGVYVTPEAFAASNGTGSNVPVGTIFFYRVNLSPKLFGAQHQRLPAILAHEMSHAHVQGWIGVSGFIRLPAWFKEGLAVMISGGGGAELVSEEKARAAFQRGERIAVDAAGSLASIGDIRFERPPESVSASWYPVVLAYRQAGMFVAYLRESDEIAFATMMNAILDGRPFSEAVDVGYHRDIASLWQEFGQRIAQYK